VAIDCVLLVKNILGKRSHSQDIPEGYKRGSPLLGDGAARLPHNFVWVQQCLSLAVDLSAKPFQGEEWISVPKFLKWALIQSHFLCIHLPQERSHAPAHCFSLSPSGPRMDCPKQQWDCSKASWKWNHCEVTEIRVTLSSVGLASLYLQPVQSWSCRGQDGERYSTIHFGGIFYAGSELRHTVLPKADNK